MPEININTPVSKDYSSNELPIYLNFNSSKILKNAYFILNNGAQVDITGKENQNIKLNPNIGNNLLNLSIIDNTNLKNNKAIAFSIKDISKPNITVNDPAYQNSLGILLSANVFDDLSALSQSCEVCISSDGVCDTEWISAISDFSPGSKAGKCYYNVNKNNYNNVQYKFNFRISDVENNQGIGSEKYFIIDKTAPAEVTGAAATTVAKENSLQISWNPTSDSDFKEYRIYRSASPETLIKIINTKSTGSYKDTNLESSKTYTYRISVVDSYSNENTGVTVSGKVADTTIPIISVTSPTQYGNYNYYNISLIYTVNENSSCSYNLNGANKPVSSIINAKEGTNNLLVFCSDGTNTGYSPNITFYVDTIPPAKITNVNITQPLNELILNLNWVSNDANKFYIYRDNKTIISLSNNILLGNSNQNSYIDSYNLIANQTYYYAIIPEDSSGNKNTDFNVFSKKVIYNPPQYCSDGTAYNSCSATKPKYCDNGNLIDDCTKCGCDSGYTCNSSTKKCISLTKSAVITITSPKNSERFNITEIPVSYTTDKAVSDCEYLNDLEQSLNYNIKWNLIKPNFSDEYVSVRAEDINNDNKKEIIALSYQYPYPYKYSFEVYDALGNLIRTFYPETNKNISIKDFLIGDINNDGKNEIIALIEYITFIYPRKISNVTLGLIIYDNQFNIINTIYVGETMYGAEFSMDDIDNDNLIEIIVLSRPPEDPSPYIKAFKPNGNIVFYRSWNNLAFLSNIAIADVDNDNKKEIAFALNDMVYVLKNNGEDYSSNWPISNNVTSFNKLHNVVIGNIDNDLKKDIITQHYDSIRVYDINGNLKTQINKEKLNYGYTNGAVIVSNLDNNKDLEIIGLTNPYHEELPPPGSNATPKGVYGFLRFFDKNGNKLNPDTKYFEWADELHPVTFDIDNDNELEIIFSSYYQYASDDAIINAHNADSTIVPGFPINLTTINIRNKIKELIITDIDNDNKLDIIAIGKRNNDFNPGIAVIGIESNILGTTNPWPQYKHDNYNTANYDTLDSACTEGSYCDSKHAKVCTSGQCVYRQGNPFTGKIIANEGYNRLLLMCKDSDNLLGVSNVVNFYVNLSKEQLIIDITSPKNNSYYPKNPIILNFTSNREVKKCSTELNGNINNFDISLIGIEGINKVKLLCSDFDNINASSELITFFLDTIAPPLINNFNIKQINNTLSAQLSWGAYAGGDFLNYNIYRSQTEFTDVSSITPIAKKTTNDYNDINLNNGTYYYAVTIVDKAYNENKSVLAKRIDVADNDNVNPIVNINFIGVQIYGTVKLFANVTDNKGLKESCQVCISSDGFCDTEWVSANNEFSNGNLKGVCSYVWDTENYEKINYSYNFRVTDLSNNMAVGILMKTKVIYPPPKTCIDNTNYSACSLTKPKYCQNGTLIDNCQLCGCSLQKEVCNLNRSCFIPKCSDGTEYNSCSINKPNFCDNGTIINKCSLCGCSNSSICNLITNKCETPKINQTCNDGTGYGYCSLINKPKYCDNGILIDNCQLCGCNNDSICDNSTRKCNIPPPPEFTLYLYPGWNIFSIPKGIVDTSIESVLINISGKYESVYSYDTQTGNWLTYIANKSLFDSSNSFTNFEVGKGYWIYMIESATVTFNVDVTNGFSKTLSPGWNFIGYPYNNPKQIETSLSSLNNNYDIIYSYDNQKKEWIFYSPYTNPILNNTLNEMQPGKGYWIYLYEQSTWQI